MQFYTKTAKTAPIELTCPPLPVSLTQTTPSPPESQIILNLKSLLLTGLESAHLAQGHSAAGEKEMVSRTRQLAQFLIVHCSQKDWIFSGSCVMCCIHTDPLILLNPSIHCLFPNSSPVHYVIRSVMVEQDRCVSRLKGSIWVNPPWFLPSPSVLWSGISPLG